MTLKGKVALVTGASMGIGASAAVALAREGAKVGINFRSHRDTAEKVAEQVRAAGGEAMLLQADVADQQAVEKMTADLIDNFGPIDVAVSNAAFSERELFHLADMEGFRRTIDVTMWGAFYVVRAAAQKMIEQKSGGSIVIVSSPHGYTPVPRSMAYNMSKGAIDQMMRTAAIELAEHGIRVNSVVPGWIDTPGERKFATEETIERAGKGIPAGRLGHPDEIGRVVAMLCDPKSAYMIGSAVLIDGGITLPWWANRGSAAPQ